VKSITSLRLWLMGVGALAVIYWLYATDPDPAGARDTLGRLQHLALVVLAAFPTYAIRRALFPDHRSRDLGELATGTALGAGVMYLGKCILTGLIFMAVCGYALADNFPMRAWDYLPTLKQEQRAYWPDLTFPQRLAGQVEQETCPSLKSAKCWNPRAELKTSREYGFGLGQLTMTPRFDNFAVARGLDLSLRDWEYADRYDAARQLRTLVLMDRACDRRLRFVEDADARAAMMFACYNGGAGGVLSDIRLCGATEGCDPGRWFGHVERTSLKARRPASGYGKSFFEINREYVRNVMTWRSERYAGLL